MGRVLRVPRMHDKIAWFSFDDLCKQPLSAIDYLGITDNFHTVFIHSIPDLDVHKNGNEMRRFITLIDILYEGHIRTICSAESLPHLIYIKQDVKGRDEEESFAFDRTVSRLLEMQSKTYLEEHATKYSLTH